MQFRHGFPTASSLVPRVDRRNGDYPAQRAVRPQTIGTSLPCRGRPPACGVSLIELLVVMVIITIMVAMYMPALHRARQAAQRTICENRLHQLAIAMNSYVSAQRRLPPPATPNTASGWSVELLEFLEQRPLQLQIQTHPTLNPVSLSTYVTTRPSVLSCPFGYEGDSTIARIPVGQYILAVDPERKNWMIGDSLTSFRGPWATSPEMGLDGWENQDGPHDGGFYIANSDGSVVFKSK